MSKALFYEFYAVVHDDFTVVCRYCDDVTIGAGSVIIQLSYVGTGVVTQFVPHLKLPPRDVTSYQNVTRGVGGLSGGSPPP